MQLPFLSAAPVRCYLHHAYATGLLGDARRLGIICPDYINLELRQGDVYSGEANFLDFSPYVDLGTFAARGFLSIRNHSVEFLTPLNAATFCDHLAVWLKNGTYVLLYLDAFYAPWSALFSKAHRSIQHLVLGWDGAAFIGVNYLKDESFGACRVSAGQLWQSVAGQPGLKAPFTADKIVREVRLNEHPEAKVPWTLIRQRFGSFLDSRPSDGAAPEANFQYGLDCYRAVAEEIRRAVARGRPVDLRKTRLLFERAALLGAGLDQAAGGPAGEIPPPGEWRRISALLQAFHLSCYKYNSQGHRLPGSLPRVEFDLIERAAAQEEALLGQVLLHR